MTVVIDLEPAVEALEATLVGGETPKLGTRNSALEPDGSSRQRVPASCRLSCAEWVVLMFISWSGTSS
jgi:hypothetical protein